MTDKLLNIARQFALQGEIEKIEALGEGFINDTFIVRTQVDAPDYILQRKNKAIFPNVPAMMDNIVRVTDHIRAKVIAAGGDAQREVMTIIPTIDGKYYCIDEDGEYWAVCVYISDTTAFTQVDSVEIARKGGEGIGRFQAMLADFKEPLYETIKGFHNMRSRFEQWDATVARDAAGRVAELTEEISWIEARRARIMDFWQLVEQGRIPMRVTHNDTKITNILFNPAGEVLCVIDLDTVMSAISLNDVGDAIRTYTNTGAEDDRDLSKVSMSMPMFEGYVDGYLSQTAGILEDIEIEYLAFAGILITFEQVLRFLMDYIDGDTYYRIKYPEHNLVRTKAQYALLQSIESQYDKMCEVVKTIAQKYR